MKRVFFVKLISDHLGQIFITLIGGQSLAGKPVVIGPLVNAQESVWLVQAVVWPGSTLLRHVLE
jgi:hypothetical protein